MHTFLFKNQYSVQITVYGSQNAHTSAVLLPALGVPMAKYQRVIEGLCAAGFEVICADYPCCGANRPRVGRAVNYDYADLIADFIPPLLACATGPNAVLIGHSLGGHLAALYSTLHPINVIGVATGNIHYQNWQGWARYRIWVFAVLLRLLTWVYGYYPGYKLGFGNRETRGLMQNWSHSVWTGRFDYFAKNIQPSTAAGCFIHIEGDDFAPLLSAQKLAALFLQPKISSVALAPNTRGNVHSAWLKAPAPVLAAIVQWLGAAPINPPR